MSERITPELDLSRYDLITASEKLYEYVCAKARDWGQDPNVECAYITPGQPAAKDLGALYRVMWEAGPYNWGMDLSLDGVTFMKMDAPFDRMQPAVVMGEPKDWYLQPHFGCDVGFVPKNNSYWNLDISQSQAFSQIIEVTGHAAQNLLARLDLHPELLRETNRRLFEELVAEIFDGFGYEVELTKRTRDGGKDIIALKTIDSICLRYLIECKRPDQGNAVTVSTVRELLGVSADDPATKSLLVTTTSFTKDAKALIDRHQWRLEGKEYNDVILWASQYNRIKSARVPLI